MFSHSFRISSVLQGFTKIFSFSFGGVSFSRFQDVQVLLGDKTFKISKIPKSFLRGGKISKIPKISCPSDDLRGGELFPIGVIPEGCRVTDR